MPHFFNTAGPVNPEDHYSLPPLTRWDMEEVLTLLEQKQYFVLHAPRQTGKTTSLLALMDKLNTEGHYNCLYVNIEPAQVARSNLALSMPTIIRAIATSARDYINDTSLLTMADEVLAQGDLTGCITEMLSRWSSQSSKPVVLLLDEVDSLIGDTLVSLLRQLRAGYTKRPKAFPQSILLCGVRDVRDYRIHTKSKEIITGGSAFNIKAKSLRLSDFNQKDITKLYRQHTQQTGQTFAKGVVDYVWEQTHGQPWLVNALANEACFEMKSGRDRSQPITIENMHEARENLIQRREIHLDQLADKLQEPRVNRVISALLSGEQVGQKFPSDDLQYVEDLGLVTRIPEITIANGIYREVIPRELIWTTQYTIHQETAWYLDTDQRLNMKKLLTAFQAFFREHSEAWIECFDYKEAGPQLLLQAFLQRIINGGGRIDREYGLGRRRTDLYIQWPLSEKRYNGPIQKIVIELKIQHNSLEYTQRQGLEQIADYVDKTGADQAHLLIFNRDTKTLWDNKIYHQTERHAGKTIEIWGM